MQRSSRDPSVDFYEHSTQRGSTPGVDYFAQASQRRNQRFATGANTPDSSSVSGIGGIPSRSGSQFEGFTSIGRDGQPINNNNQQGGGATDKENNVNEKQQSSSVYAQAHHDAPESLADEVPARHLSIIEVARQMLLPVFYERLLDRQGLIQSCGTVLDQFLELEKMGLQQMNAPPDQGIDPNQPLSDQDITQVQKLVQGQLQEIQKKRPQHHHQGGSSVSGGVDTQSDFGGSSLGGRRQSQVRLNRRGDNNNNNEMDEEDEAFLNEQMSTPGGRNKNQKDNRALARVSGDDGLEQTTLSGGSAHPQQYPSSIFRSVTYSNKGPLPAPPPPPLPQGRQAASDAFLKLSLDKPHLTTSNSDIVITGIVHTRALVDLRWWIAYGPMQLVIDLEKLRSVGAVGTFQVSHSAFILSIGAGTLIPGAEYTVHLAANAVDFAGIGKDARITFTVPVAEDETDDILWNRLQRMTSSGYSGDTEKGILSLKPDREKMKELENEYFTAKREAAEQAQKKEASAKAKLDEKDRRAKILAATKANKIDSAAASRLLMSGQQLPANIQAEMDRDEEMKKERTGKQNNNGDDDYDTPNLQGTNLPDAAVALANASNNPNSNSPRGLTYHEQLRNFIVNEVEPIYTLCASPRFTHEIFLDMLRKITKQFWFSRPGGSGILDRDLKKQILTEVKKEISDYMQKSSGKVLVTTASGGSPKAAEMLQGSLEQISSNAELGTSSLLSPEQRERLKHANIRSGGGDNNNNNYSQQNAIPKRRRESSVVNNPGVLSGGGGVDTSTSP